MQRLFHMVPHWIWQKALLSTAAIHSIFRRGSTERSPRHRAVLCNRNVTSAISHGFLAQRIIREDAMEYFEATVELQNLQTSFVWNHFTTMFPCACAVIPCNFAPLYSHKKCAVYFTDKVSKNNAHVHATSSKPPFLSLSRGLWWRLACTWELKKKTLFCTKTTS